MTLGERHTRVLLADDNLPVREGLKRLINDQPDMEIVAETGDAQEALQLAQRLSPDVALVDVSMPGWDGVKLARKMNEACPSLNVIAVTRHNDGGFVKEMMTAGARGFVLKQNATKNLVAAVRACVGGEVYVDAGVRAAAPPFAAGMAPMPGAATQHEPLTTIEDEVLRLFASASSIQHIAEQLGLDREEVVRAKESAMRKLGFTTRLQAMNYVQSRTLNSPD